MTPPSPSTGPGALPELLTPTTDTQLEALQRQIEQGQAARRSERVRQLDSELQQLVAALDTTQGPTRQRMLDRASRVAELLKAEEDGVDTSTLPMETRTRLSGLASQIQPA